MPDLCAPRPQFPNSTDLLYPVAPGGVRIDGTGATLAEAPPLAMEQHYNRKVRARISEMANRCKLVVESSGRARYSNIEEEIEYFGVSLKYAPVPSILTPP
jgi:hypothetical protein